MRVQSFSSNFLGFLSMLGYLSLEESSSLCSRMALSGLSFGESFVFLYCFFCSSCDSKSCLRASQAFIRRLAEQSVISTQRMKPMFRRTNMAKTERVACSRTRALS